jgi:hypothetical protein
MRWNRPLSLLLTCGTIVLAGAAANPANKDALQSFYVARFFFSDDLPEWSHQILDVESEGNDVRVRVIRISLANELCPDVIVRAAEHVFPHTSVRKIAGRDLCKFTSEGVDSALKAAAPQYARDYADSATEMIVAKCGRQEKEFDFPYPAEVDEKALKRSNPEVSALWDTNYRVFTRALGKNFSFNTLTPEQARQTEELGAKLVPELISGKYQTAYGGSQCAGKPCDNYLAWQLEGYSGAPQPYDPAVATLIDASSFHFIKYLSPPGWSWRIAQAAHVYGDVRLRIVADLETGVVIEAEAISGPPLLALSALPAARSWQFDPKTLSGKPIEVTLRFEVKCR